MLVLGIETATAQASVALGGPDGVISSFHLINKGRHAESLTPAIEFVCRQAGKAIADITAIAVDNGPGLFTGLRVGLATAKSIAYARGIPAFPVSSLEILAHGARLTDRKIVAVIDALSDEVYYATYFRGKELIAPALGRPEDVAAQLQDDVLLVGDGATRYADLFSGSRVEIAARSFQYPSAVSLVELAIAKGFTNVPDVQIAYLRKPYVHTND
ncbi:MAG TPA: tRNA (adenosine(37)-N6)-threonylcarbamoyltransferase complex dimerization subunit type 1 TsaB [Thermoanaerobaculia bacterium]